MLFNVTLENFRSIKEQQTVSFEVVTDTSLDQAQRIEVDERFDLLKVAAVVGPNGSGKSAVLRAVVSAQSFVLAGENDKNPLNVMVNSSFAYDKEWVVKPSIITIRSVIGIDEETGLAQVYCYTLEADKEKVYRENLYVQIGRSTKRMFERYYLPEESAAAKKPVYGFSWGKTYEGDKKKLGKRVPHNRSFLQAAAQAGGDSVMPMYNWFKNTLSVIPLGLASTSEQIIINKLKQHPNWRRKIVDFLWCMDLLDIRDIRIAEKDGVSRLVLIHGAGDNRMVNYFSNDSLGVRRLTFIAITFMEAFISGKTIISDDFSLFLHFGITTHLLQTFIKGTDKSESQLLISGVDNTLMDDTLIRRDGIWFTTKGHSGGSIYYSLADYKYRKKHDVASMYKNGAFGALPILSDFIFDRTKEA